jgi:hypothetical protein
MMKILIICALMLTTACLPGYCAEVAEGQEVSTASGKIVATDWVGSFVVVRIKFPGDVYDEMTFHVSRDTKITKGSSSLTFGELHDQERVTIEYFNKRFQGLHAIHITVTT